VAKASEWDNFEQFMEAVARLLGIPRKKLDRIVFQGRTSLRTQRHQSIPRHRNPPKSVTK